MRLRGIELLYSRGENIHLDHVFNERRMIKIIWIRYFWCEFALSAEWYITYNLGDTCIIIS